MLLGGVSASVKHMNKLILVRYGEHEGGHLTEQGKQAMLLAVEKIKSFVQNKNACVVAAKINRAVESAKIISKNLNVPMAGEFSELYAAQEEGVAVNLDAATLVIHSVGERCYILIAVVSREYIETLPNHILRSLRAQEVLETHLNRGEALVLDYEAKKVTYLK